jgi:WD40 repeat protein
VVFSSNGETVSALGDLSLDSWNVRTGKQVHALKLPWDLAQHPRAVSDGRHLACLLEYRPPLHLYNAATGQEIRQLDAPEYTQPVAFTADGRRLVCADYNSKVIRLVDVTTGELIQECDVDVKGAFRVACSADGKTMLVWEFNGPIHCWDLASRRKIRQIVPPRPISTQVVALSPNGQTVAADAADGTISWWQVATGKQLRSIQAHRHYSTALAFSPDGAMLASGNSWDGVLQIWDIITGTNLHVYAGHQAGITDLGIAPDGRTIATASQDLTLRLWDSTNGKELRRFASDGWGAAYSPDGKVLATVRSPGCTVALLDAVTGKQLHSFPCKQQVRTPRLAFSPDGKMLTVSAGFGQAYLWEVPGGRVIREFAGHDVWTTAFSADGTLLAVSGDEMTELWDLEQDRLVRRFGSQEKKQRASRGYAALAFSPDGKWLVAAGLVQGMQDGKLRPDGCEEVILLIETATGIERRILRGHRGLVQTIQFSPDGRTIVSGGADGTVRLWETSTGQERRCLEGHRGAVTCVAFAPDGRSVISGSSDSTALIWDVQN